MALTKATPGVLSKAYVEKTDDTQNVLGGTIALTEAPYTIASGAITPTRSNIELDAEGAGTTDTLDQIVTTSLSDDTIIILSVAAAQVITINDAGGAAGQIHLIDNADFVMSGNERLCLIRDGADWYELWRTTDAMTTLGAVQDATSPGSETTMTFTGIPAGVNWVTMGFLGLSNTATSNFLVQLGDSGGLEASGYLSSAAGLTTSSVNTVTSSTAGIIILMTAAAAAHGQVTFRRFNSNQWTAQGSVRRDANTTTWFSGSTPDLTTALTQIGVTTVGGSGTFDAGTVNIQYGY
jgi:hypothetical protein